MANMSASDGCAGAQGHDPTGAEQVRSGNPAADDSYLAKLIDGSLFDDGHAQAGSLDDGGFLAGATGLPGSRGHDATLSDRVRRERRASGDASTSGASMSMDETSPSDHGQEGWLRTNITSGARPPVDGPASARERNRAEVPRGWGDLVLATAPAVVDDVDGGGDDDLMGGLSTSSDEDGHIDERRHTMRLLANRRRQASSSLAASGGGASGGSVYQNAAPNGGGFGHGATMDTMTSEQLVKRLRGVHRYYWLILIGTLTCMLFFLFQSYHIAVRSY